MNVGSTRNVIVEAGGTQVAGHVESTPFRDATTSLELLQAVSKMASAPAAMTIFFVGSRSGLHERLLPIHRYSPPRMSAVNGRQTTDDRRQSQMSDF